MSIKTSTGLRDYLLDSGSLKDALDLGFINIYKGTAPATADAAVTPADLLVTISVSSGATGLSFAAAAAAGVISKDETETWSGVNLATGTATWYRHVGSADDGLLSTTQPRIQGNVALINAALNLSAVALTLGATQTIDYYSVAIPTL